MPKSPLIIVAKTHTVQQTELFMVWTGKLSCWKRHEFLHGWTGVQTKVSECVTYWCEFI